LSGLVGNVGVNKSRWHMRAAATVRRSRLLSTACSLDPSPPMSLRMSLAYLLRPPPCDTRRRQIPAITGRK
jgi:hypothetical protein